MDRDRTRIVLHRFTHYCCAVHYRTTSLQAKVDSKFYMSVISMSKRNRQENLLMFVQRSKQFGVHGSLPLLCSFLKYII